MSLNMKEGIKLDYNELISANKKYGNTESGIIKHINYEKVLKNVIIAPWWSHDMFDILDLELEQIDDKLYNFYGKDIEFTFIELKAIGASVIMDKILPLGLTKCENIIFLGSAGALDKDINIGDIVIPEFSICGDGASRYLNTNFEDEFGKRKYPSTEYTNKLINILSKQNGIKYHVVPNYSIDTVFAQFYHLEEIVKMGAKTVEMETACVFKCNELLNINVTALLCISDNSLCKKSLYQGRSDAEQEYRHTVRNRAIPKIIYELIKS